MRTFVLVILFHSSSAVFHSLKYFSVGSSGLSNLPEFVCVSELDGVEMFRYDSNTRRLQPTQDWIHTLKADDPDHWRQETENLMRYQRNFQNNMDPLGQHFNQNGGIHMLQRIHGCEWDDETGDADGFMKYGYGGEDVLAFDLKTKTWVPPKNQTLIIIKHLWDNDTTGNIRLHHFLSQECPEWGKKYLKYGRSSLLRTEVPSVFLLQRNTSSPISCLATGFFPDRAVLFWTKDEEELHEGVHIGEILPNHDGTFQTSADLDPPPHEDWHRYQCVFQLSGLKEKLVTTLDKAAVKSNSAPSAPTHRWRNISIILAVVAAFLLLCVIGFFVYKKKQNCEKGASHHDPLAGVSTEEMRKLSSSGTGTQAADSALSISDDSEAPPLDSGAPLMEGGGSTEHAG